MTTYKITKAYSMDEDTGLDKACGYDLYRNDEWCNRFWLRRDAKAAMLAAMLED